MRDINLSRDDTRAVFDHLAQCWLDAVADVCGWDLEDGDGLGRGQLLYELDLLLKKKLEHFPAGNVRQALDWMLRKTS